MIAAFLVYCTYLANFTITAAVVEEEGTGTQAASAGLVNALTFILPAIIGGFAIALLFKYRKKLTLKFFFGGALFFAGAFIAFFFGDSILFLIESKFYGLFIFDFDPYDFNILGLSPLITNDGIYYLMIVSCFMLSFWLTYIITSWKFNIKTKNYALLFQSALMGAFLSVILPTYTVVILLIGLSLYDIYSVRRGPIKDIVKYSMEDDAKDYTQITQKNLPSDSKMKSNFAHLFSIKIVSEDQLILTETMSNENERIRKNPMKSNISDYSTNKLQNLNNHSSRSSGNMQNSNFQNQTHQLTTDYTQNQNERYVYKKIIVPKSKQKPVDDNDNLLTSMTYSSRDWDIGIGDLVFYSLLASQPLTPYFIFNHGTHLLETFGLWIFWIICFFTIIGILIGFLTTIRLLERNSMLPGLPLSIALGLTGFLGSTLIFSII